MANEYFQPGEARARKVDELFTAIATKYDLVNDLQSFGLHRRWKQKVVSLASVKPGGRALDVCCGTGDLARRLAKAGAVVTGIDFNQAMLDRAAAAREGGRLLTWVRGDALRLPFAEGTFDAVTIGYGLRNLANWRAGLTEIKRVTAPGGRIVVLEFGRPKNSILRSLYFGYLRFALPVLGRLTARNPAAYAYILESLKAYPAQQGVLEAMQDLGLVRTGVQDFFAGAMSINFGIKKPD